MKASPAEQRADLKFTFQMTAVRMKDGLERCTLKF